MKYVRNFGGAIRTSRFRSTQHVQEETGAKKVFAERIPDPRARNWRPFCRSLCIFFSDQEDLFLKFEETFRQAMKELSTTGRRTGCELKKKKKKNQ
ncbi:unnamed protein product [Caenorhabditis sp. 36 PRJEB53466]|nr:unnamed protein product [Caenorhabditis sp. 36 PRJEB53466]